MIGKKFYATLSMVSILSLLSLIEMSPANALAPIAFGSGVLVISPGATMSMALVEIRMSNGIAIPIGTLNVITGEFTPSGVSRSLVTALGADAALSEADRASIHLTVKDFGAEMTGAVDDSLAFNKARMAAGINGSVFVPPGQINITSGIIAQEKNPVIWQMSGNTYGVDGTTPVTNIGNDWVHTFIGLKGGDLLSHSATTPGGSPVQRVDLNVNYTGGTSGYVVPAQQINCTIPRNTANLADYIWCQAVTLTSSGTGGAANHVASSSRVVRPVDALVDGRGSRSQIWADYREVSDQTNTAAPAAGSAVIGEWDMYANGADPNNQRLGLDIEIARAIKGSALPMRMGLGYTIGAQNDADISPTLSRRSWVGTAYNVALAFDHAAFDASNGDALIASENLPAPAFRMASGMSIDYSGDNQHTESFDRTTGCKIYKHTEKGVTLINSQICDDGSLKTANVHFGVGGVGAAIEGHTVIGFDTSAATLSGAAFKMKQNQSFALEGTSSVTMRYSNNLTRFSYHDNDTLEIDNKGNIAAPGSFTGIGFQATGHNLVAGIVPTLSSCGIYPMVSGSDNAGVVTTGTGTTACTLTFAKAYAGRPYCTVTGEESSVSYRITNLSIIMTTKANTNIDYQCTGQSGG